MYLRESNEVNSVKRKDFIPGKQHLVCSQHFNSEKSKTDPPMFLLYFQYFLSPNRKPSKSPAQRKKIGTGKSRALAEAVVEEVDFCVDLLVPVRRKELT